EELAWRLDAEVAARTGLASRVDAEVATRETLARDLTVLTERSQSAAADYRQSDMRLLQLRAEVINQNRRVSIFLEEARKRLPAPLDQNQLAAIADEEKHALDAL